MKKNIDQLKQKSEQSEPPVVLAKMQSEAKLHW